jgi:primosomal protein N' (replication factor Y)
MRTAQIASVALVAPVDKPYSYQIPDELSATVKPGSRVQVEFGRGRRLATAFCLEVSEAPWDSSLRPIVAVLDDPPILTPKLLELGRWISRYYFSHLGRTLDLMTPAAAKRRAGWTKSQVVRLLDKSPTDTPPKSKKQESVLTVLGAAPDPMDLTALCSAADCSPAIIRSMAKNGMLLIESIVSAPTSSTDTRKRHEPTFTLSEDQQSAIDQILPLVRDGGFSVPVLFGVTGSGKTEVYVAAIRQAIALGRQAIFLVPEIALTTQTSARLSERFERVAILHSGLSETKRSQIWSLIAGGHIDVIIGARSAIFAPCPNLGLIVVDEEAESSYKSQASPRYHARDVAVMRGSIEKIPVIFGSATPSLETWRNVHDRKHYQLIRLPKRVRGLPMPQLHLVDMQEEHAARPGVHMLSREMEARLKETLEKSEQAVLLLNRRGYAGFLHCAKCRTVITCPKCDVHMVFHATTGQAHCHHCHHKMPMPHRCAMTGCGGSLVRFGIGTQRVEEELAKKFPNARVRRMDSDSMKKTSDYSEVIAAFERREFDILVGTQMVAKGLDFPFVSFVGIISADTALSLNDFRAEERTFQLVLQVSGRSGRGDAPGIVVVQTFAKDSIAIAHAVKGDYESFAKRELNIRRIAKLPPYMRLVRIVVSAEKATRAQESAKRAAQQIDQAMKKSGIRAEVYGPMPAPIFRIRDAYRYDLLLKFPTADALMSAGDLFKTDNLLRAGTGQVMVDVDPVSLQ